MDDELIGMMVEVIFVVMDEVGVDVVFIVGWYGL